MLARRGIAREGNAGGGCLSAIAEHHGLHVHRRAPIVGDVIHAPIGLRARRLPRPEHRADRAPELIAHIVGERPAQFLLHMRLVAVRDALQVFGFQIGIVLVAFVFFLLIEDFLERAMLQPQHHVGIHLDEAAIAVIGEARIAGELGKAFGRRRIEAEVQHRIHHARHGHARTRAHRHQQRPGRIAQCAFRELAHGGERGFHIGLQRGWISFAVLIVMGADFRGDGEARGDRQAQIAHLRQVRALAAEQVLHGGLAFRLAVSERINPFGH